MKKGTEMLVSLRHFGAGALTRIKMTAQKYMSDFTVD